MDAGALFLAFVSGGALATLTRAVYERGQRVRDQMTEAAASYLGARDDASRQLHEYQESASEFLSARNDALDAVEQLTEATAGVQEQVDGANGTDTPEAFWRALAVARRLRAAGDLGIEEANAIASAATHAIADLAGVAETPLEPLRHPVMRVLRQQVRFARALHANARAGEEARAGIRQAHAIIPRLRLLFADRSGAAPAADSAQADVEGLLAVLTAISDAGTGQVDAVLDDRVNECFRGTTETVNAFALAANRRMRWFRAA